MIKDRPRLEKFLTLLQANNKGADQCTACVNAPSGQHLCYSLSGKLASCKITVLLLVPVAEQVGLSPT